MSHLTKYTLEFPVNYSASILYNKISTASGLAKWFADDVIVKDKIFTFIWEGSEQKALRIKKKKNHYIRFKWLDETLEEQEVYFEFLIQIDKITQNIALVITDFAENEEEKEEQTNLWCKQIQSLKTAISL